MPTIYVSRNGNSMQLKLRDSEGHNPGDDHLTTTVNPGDSVQWELDPNGSGLQSITSVAKSIKGNAPNDNVDLLASPPVSNNGIFTGTIVSTPPGNGTLYENYKIGFQVPNDGNTYYDDPKLQMNA